MFTRKRLVLPTSTNPEVQALGKAISDYLLSLESKNSLTLSQAQIYVDQGLQFPATQVASADANNLDDYAEKNWIPVVTFATPGNLSVAYTSQIGKLTKKGREVTASFTIQCVPTFTTSSGALQITGLSYSAASLGTRLYVDAMSVFQGITKAGYTAFAANMVDNSSVINIAASGSGVSVDDVLATNIASGSTLLLRGKVTFNV